MKQHLLQMQTMLKLFYINGLTYVPAGDDGTKFVNYYANGTFTKGTDYVAIDTVVPEVSTSAA